MSTGQESTLGGDGKHACKVKWLGGGGGGGGGGEGEKVVERRDKH